jgi:DNA polymerase/3'-5' exonuclease PolX
MSRGQVEGVAALVREAAVKALQEKGMGPETLLLEICGGYRRGKEENGDADVLVSCTQAEGQSGLREAMKRIFQEEMKLDMIFLKEGSGTVQGYPTSSPHEKVESHDNTLTLIKYEGVYRRLDIISPPPDQWAFCILGWSGNRQMEKDLRDYSNDKGFHLSQQALYKHAKRVKNPKSEDGVFHTEEDIWTYMGLKFLHPRLRWA